MSFIIGKKIEMTQLFDDKGKVIPVTVIDVKDNYVVQHKTEETDGYEAVVIGYGKKNKPNKAEKTKYKETELTPEASMEFRNVEAKEIGSEIKPSEFEINTKVDVSGVSKGKGFQGVVKKFKFAGGPKTHGQSDRHRAPGSIGSGTTPGRVYKGKKMPGRLGGDKTTVQNLKVVKVDDENGLLVVKGAVPGKRGTILKIKKSRL